MGGKQITRPASSAATEKNENEKSEKTTVATAAAQTDKKDVAAKPSGGNTNTKPAVSAWGKPPTAAKAQAPAKAPITKAADSSSSAEPPKQKTADVTKMSFSAAVGK